MVYMAIWLEVVRINCIIYVYFVSFYDCKVTDEDWDTLLLNKMYVIHNKE